MYNTYVYLVIPSQSGHPISESSVQNTKKVYLEKLKTEPDPAKIVRLSHASQRCPLMIGEFDSDIDSYIRSIRLVGVL